MAALLDIVTKGATDRSVTLRIIDSTDGTPETGVVYNTTGIDLWYRREGAAKVSITEATLAALDTAHTDGGFLHIGDGEYRLDLPDAAFATGANYVDVGGTVTGMIVIGGRVRLIGANLEDAVRLGLTALPNAAADAAGGLPVSDAGGLALDTLNSNVAAILTDTAEIGAAGAGLSALPWNAAWDAEVQSEAADALTAYDPPTNAEMEARTLAAASYFDPSADTVTVGTNNDKTGYALSSAGVQAIWDYVITGTTKAVEMMRGFAAVLLGKASGLDTTSATYRDIADSKDVIVATVDENGNRTAITRDLS